MKVGDLARRDVAACRADDSLERAAQLMWERDVGGLPVLDDGGRVVAMITDRDICMGAYTHGLSLGSIPVWASMSKTLVSCRVDDDVIAAEHSMRHHKVRRVPVVDAEQRLVGIVTLNDLARVANAHRLPASDIVATVAEVGSPPWSLAPCR